MDRRRFISLAGLAAAFCFPLVARAGQSSVMAGRAVSGFFDAIHSLNTPLPWQTSGQATVIKVIGVGGAGGNSVDHMMRDGISGVEFMVANTDVQALRRSTAMNRLQLGKSGLGAGANRVAGRDAAMEVRTRIAESLADTHMAFIVAGMGGGTGTGAAPIIAEVARELGIVTAAFVTTPFSFEGNRLTVADAGVAELSRYVNALIVLPNDRIIDALGDDISMDEAFKAADNLMHYAVDVVAKMINRRGVVGVDFEDVRTVLGRTGYFGRDAVHSSLLG